MFGRGRWPLRDLGAEAGKFHAREKHGHDHIGDALGAQWFRAGCVGIVPVLSSSLQMFDSGSRAHPPGALLVRIQLLPAPQPEGPDAVIEHS